MRQLIRLDISGDDVGDLGLPAEVIESGDAQAILAAYRAFRQAQGQDDIEHQIPANQKPGYQFALQADGRIDLQPSGLAPPDELAEILAMRGVIIEAVDDLILLAAGSNAYDSVAKTAERYKWAISASELSIDLLYGYGVRLENSRSRLEIEIENDPYLDMTPAVGEALDTVIALHGPIVYSTARGRELVERARAYEAPVGDDAAYKQAAQQVAAAIDEAKQAVTELARETIRQAVSEIGEGKHPERSADIGHTTVSNFMIGAAKGVQKALSPEVIAETMTKAAYMGAATAAIGATGYYAGMPLLGFFLANKALLYDFSVAAGCELTWLRSFLNWLELQRALLKR